MLKINRREFLGWILLLPSFFKSKNNTDKPELPNRIIVVDNWFLLEQDLKNTTHKISGEWLAQ